MFDMISAIAQNFAFVTVYSIYKLENYFYIEIKFKSFLFYTNWCDMIKDYLRNIDYR